jgi:hypothetical protein
MDRVILDQISFDVDREELRKLLRISPDTKEALNFYSLFEIAAAIARPKAAFLIASPLSVCDNKVEINGVRFTSRLLRDNLERSAVVFPYVATCGSKLEDWSRNMNSLLKSFWAETIMLAALGCAIKHLNVYLKERIGEELRLSSMNPGSLAEWPLSEQATLFYLLGESAEAIGTSLSDSMVIRPLKSLSGIHFVSEDGFVNCSLCPRKDCSGRRAPYDKGLYT